MRSFDKEAARRHWDELAVCYTRYKEINHDYFDALKALFAAALPEAVHWAILEVGCGNGDLLRSLRPRRGLGLDVSSQMIALARSRHSDCGTLEFQIGDAEALAFGRVYDAVILPDLLEHVPDWRRALSQAAECVKLGGILALSTPNPLWAPALYILDKLGLKTPEGPHRYIGLRAIVRHLQHLDLVVVAAGTHLLVPKDFGVLTERLNQTARKVPGIAGLGLIQFAAAARAE